MPLYLDDDSIDGVFVKLLRRAGHEVAIPSDAGLAGADDPVHLTHAIRSGWPLFSFNHDDFEQLHVLIGVAAGHHPGILIVRRDNDRRDLKPAGMVVALSNFLASGNPLADQFVILNHYR
jgi:hypothetical protein